jgi:hypothetical protein
MMKKNMTTSICHCGVGEFRIKEFSLIKENSLLKFSCSARLQGTWNNDEMNFKVIHEGGTWGTIQEDIYLA